jgi:hypothetical protein
MDEQEAKRKDNLKEIDKLNNEIEYKDNKFNNINNKLNESYKLFETDDNLVTLEQ